MLLNFIWSNSQEIVDAEGDVVRGQIASARNVFLNHNELSTLSLLHFP
jgi:hypothetical protein